MISPTSQPKIGIVQVYDGTEGRDIRYLQSVASFAEQVGFHSFWVPDHLFFFDKYASRYPYSESGEFDFKIDQGMYDSMLALAAAAAVTSTIRLGVSVDITPLRHPLARAQQIATLDHISGGRFDYGVGVGWAEEEFEAMGVDFRRRGGIADEYLEAIRVLWTQSRATYRGEHFDFVDVVQFPKPLQTFGPPVLVGGTSPRAIRRAARLGDGWYAWGLGSDALATSLSMLRAELELTQRSATGFRLCSGNFFAGSISDVVEHVADCLELGVDEFVIGRPFSQHRYESQLTDLAEALGLRSML